MKQFAREIDAGDDRTNGRVASVPVDALTTNQLPNATEVPDATRSSNAMQSSNMTQQSNDTQSSNAIQRSNAKQPPLTRLLHLASTTLPVGAFSYSQGLEWAVEAGTVTNRAQAERWIFDCLRWSVARYEAPLLVAARHAWGAGDDALAQALNVQWLATRETSELRAETVQMGYSLQRWCNDTRALDEAWRRRLHCIESPAYPVLFAAIASAWELDARSTLTTYLWTWLENQVGAALKAVPLGQTDGQRILLAAGPLLDDLVTESIARATESPRGGWASQCPGLAIASSCHETQYSRLFRS